jgi:hypothetical protein
MDISIVISIADWRQQEKRQRQGNLQSDFGRAQAERRKGMRRKRPAVPPAPGRDELCLRRVFS